MDTRTQMAITEQDRLDFVGGVARLSLWHLASQDPTPERWYPLLTGKSPLFRLSVFWDGHGSPPVDTPDSAPPGWAAVASDVATLHQSYKPDSDTLTFEEAGLLLVWPLLEPRISEDVERWPWLPSCLGSEPPEAGIFGFFLYEFDPGDPNHVILHMGNSLAPESPFAEPPARALELLALLDDTLARNPSSERISSTSWLNCFEPFQRFFPPEWVHSAVASPPGYTYDWWGQFVSRRGAFHRANGDHLRRTGQFPYPSVTCSAPIASVRDHLITSFDLA